jgi:steroid delta-isomerase-like uncharacterized protein
MPTLPRTIPSFHRGSRDARACLLAALLALLSVPANAVDAPGGPLEALVDRYLDALQRSDIASLKELWTEDVVLVDPTAGARTQGRAALAAALEQSSSAFQSVTLDVKTRFISNGHAVVVYDGTAVVLPPGAQEPFTIHSPGVMVLRLEEGRIAEHIDYVNYPEVHRQMAARTADSR